MTRRWGSQVPAALPPQAKQPTGGPFPRGPCAQKIRIWGVVGEKAVAGPVLGSGSTTPSTRLSLDLSPRATLGVGPGPRGEARGGAILQAPGRPRPPGVATPTTRPPTAASANPAASPPWPRPIPPWPRPGPGPPRSLSGRSGWRGPRGAWRRRGVGTGTGCTIAGHPAGLSVRRPAGRDQGALRGGRAGRRRREGRGRPAGWSPAGWLAVVLERPRCPPGRRSCGCCAAARPRARLPGKSRAGASPRPSPGEPAGTPALLPPGARAGPAPWQAGRQAGRQPGWQARERGWRGASPSISPPHGSLSPAPAGQASDGSGTRVAVLPLGLETSRAAPGLRNRTRAHLLSALGPPNKMPGDPFAPRSGSPKPSQATARWKLALPAGSL